MDRRPKRDNYSMSKRVVEIIELVTGGKARTRYFKDTVMDALDRTTGDPDLLRAMRAFRRIPDAYIIDEYGEELVLFEVEDTNPISRDKLDDYLRLRDWLDNVGWQLRLFVIDRYGATVNEVPLVLHYFTKLMRITDRQAKKQNRPRPEKRKVNSRLPEWVDKPHHPGEEQKALPFVEA